MSDDVPSSIPARIAELAKVQLSPNALTPQFWRNVDAEIVGTYRAEITDPLYDKWLSLHLKHIHAVAEHPAASDVYYSFTAKASRLLKEVNARKERAGSPEAAAEAALLSDIIEDQWRVWRTDFYSPRLDKPNPGALAQVAILAAILPDDSYNERHGDSEANPPRQLFDRLPIELMLFVSREFPRRPRDPQFWNRMRDNVSAHFDPEWTDSDKYRAYLRLLVRRHGFQEGAKLLPEVQDFLQELHSPSHPERGDRSDTPRHEGISLPLLRLKTEDLAQQISEESRRASRDKPKRPPSTWDRDR